MLSTFRGPVHAGLPLFVLFVFAAAGCARHAPRANIPAAPARIGASETGVASWYGFPYHGRRTASGEIYDMERLTAAHRSLPFETWVEVTNLENGKRVGVRITDRGPFARGRIIDLSQAAARDIGMLGPGTARVRLLVIEPPPASPAAGQRPDAIAAAESYVVQAGAFADRDRAEALRATLEDRFAEARVIAGPRNLWRVVTGRELTLEQANQLAVRVRREAGAALVVPEPGPDPATSSPATPQ